MITFMTFAFDERCVVYKLWKDEITILETVFVEIPSEHKVFVYMSTLPVLFVTESF